MAGGLTEWANADFTTTPPPPQTPLAILPENNQTQVSNFPLLVWRKLPEAHYRAQLSTNSTFTSTILDTSLTDTSFKTPELQMNTSYFWRLRANDQWGGFSKWSDTWSFTTSPG